MKNQRNDYCFTIFMALLLTMIPVMGISQPVQAQETVHYVIPGGSGVCTSWADACDLQIALTAASSGSEIWAAAGTYKPTANPADRLATFQLVSGVAVYGGFGGTEISRGERDPQANLTILSGDLNGDDGENFASNGENSYHVVTGANDAILDGVTITAGNANGTYPHDMGGGMYNSNSSPTLSRVTFTGNTASHAGGGMFNFQSSPTLNSVTFAANKATGYGGGGMYNSGSSPTLTNVIFHDNSASSGGGMRNSNSSPILSSVTFSGNSAAIGGGMYNSNSSPTLSSVTFSDNSAGYGGGMYNNGSNPTLKSVTFAGNIASYVGGGGMYNHGSSPTLTNVIFHDNSASSGGGMRNSYSSLPVIRNTILWGDTGSELVNDDTSSATITSSVVQGGCPEGATCTDLISADPLLGPLGNYGGSTQTIPLLPGSSAIDAGDSSLCPATDQRGVTRPQGAGCDIGAFEYDYTGIYYVKPGGDGTKDGQSWANASDLQNALKTARSGDEIWAAAGTYKPTSDTTDRHATFQLKDGVAVYGGFAGTETSRDERSPQANLTVLSGDLNGDDGENFANNGENSYHVVTGATGALLDGVTITAGNANGTYPYDVGGGMYNESSSPSLNNSTLSGNMGRQGGAIYNAGTLNVTNTTFSGNAAKESYLTAGFGGAVFNGGTMTVTGSTFSGNEAYGTMGQGGAIFNAGTLNVTNTTFDANWAQISGGAIYAYTNIGTWFSSTFTGNSAGVGGAIYAFTGAKLTVANSTFSNNSATGSGGGLFNRGVTTVTNSTFERTKIYNYTVSNPATLTVYNSIVAGPNDWNSPRCGEGLISGSNNLADDDSCGPAFTNSPTILLGALGSYGGDTQTIPLLLGSSAIDTGNDTFCPATDQRGVPRPQGAGCDIGSFEKELAAVSLSDLEHIYDGSPKSATAATIPAGLVVEVTYDGAAEAPVTAGTYAVVATINDVQYMGSATATLTILPIATDLSVTNTDSKDPIKPGASLVYTLVVSNHGPYAAQSVIVMDNLDRDTIYVSTSAPKGWACTFANGKVTCTSSSLAAGNTATIKISVTVSKTVKIGKELINAAEVSSDTHDPITTNNSSVQKTLVMK